MEPLLLLDAFECQCKVFLLVGNGHWQTQRKLLANHYIADCWLSLVLPAVSVTEGDPYQSLKREPPASAKHKRSAQLTKDGTFPSYDLLVMK